MKKLSVAAAIVALAAALGAPPASAQGRGGGHGSGHGGGHGGGSGSVMAAPGSERGLDRADIAAGKHGARGRANARTRGSHALGFCPPGQAKKARQGSRLAC